jgi:hypothetical protein
MHMNKYYIQEVLYGLLSQVSYYYEGTKSNKKQIIHFMKSLPFFFFDHNSQSNLFDILKTKNIESYIDDGESMKQLCYMIYQEYSSKYGLDCMEIDEFYNNMILKMNQTKQQYKEILHMRLHNYLFWIVLIMLIYLYYLFIYKT